MKPVLPIALLAAGGIALVAEPLVWLWGTWSDASYASDGGLVALAVLVLLARSLLSGPAAPDPGEGALRLVVFLTDGYISNDVDIVRLIRERRGEARFFSFGVGNGVDYPKRPVM